MTDVRESNLRGSRADKRPLKAAHNEGGRGGRRRGEPGPRARVGDPGVGSAPRAPCWSQDAVLGGPRRGGPGREVLCGVAHGDPADPEGRGWRTSGGPRRILSPLPAGEGAGEVGGIRESQRTGHRDRQPQRARETAEERKTGRKKRRERAREGGTYQEAETETGEPGNDLRKAWRVW